jgi:hypothetical protein
VQHSASFAQGRERKPPTYSGGGSSCVSLRRRALTSLIDEHSVARGRRSIVTSSAGRGLRSGLLPLRGYPCPPFVFAAGTDAAGTDPAGACFAASEAVRQGHTEAADVRLLKYFN